MIPIASDGPTRWPPVIRNRPWLGRKKQILLRVYFRIGKYYSKIEKDQADGKISNSEGSKAQQCFPLCSKRD